MIRALLGGSFDPVHVGHVDMAHHVLSTGLAEVVHIVPAWLSPHKNESAATPAHRLAMVKLAFPATDSIVIEAREIDSGGVCYTIDTLTDLQSEYPGDQWLLLIGGDNLKSLHTWREAERLQAQARIMVLGRHGQDLSPAAVERAGLDRERVFGLPDFDQPVSATAVRAMLAARQEGPLAGLTVGGLPAPVASYILTHGLYAQNRM